MNEQTIGRFEQETILGEMTPAQKLDVLERESRSLLEISPHYARRRFIASFLRKRREAKDRRSDAQRTSQTTRR